ncbi:UNVERIFIED_CONTAM: DNA (cytosine-5)-methyltransferase CMT3 [Sesamum calycinum]|uniref:Cytosine-specific methyltransferase n=1 Tax=Sesamum calycinum TaxID=2727403 RepID=A0AAW2RWG6_9LAMI
MGRGRKRAEVTSSPSKPSSSSPKKLKKTTADDGSLNFVGAPVPADEAQSRWPHRYQSKSKTATILVTLSDGSTEEKEFFQARCHYTKAIVDGVVFNLFDDAYIQASEGEPDFIAKIVEMFETVSKETYICTNGFYRAKDTVIKDQDYFDTREYFIRINQLEQMDIAAKEKAKNSCDLYVDMMYTFPHAFTNNENSSVTDGVVQTKFSGVAKPPEDFQQSKRTVLDLYSGCGAMSSGLSIGASLAGENITTRWTVDFNSYACESLKSNHPNVEVRWKGYGRADDTWEPIDGLCKCKEKIKEFVSRGYRARILPLPGDVEFICGGPPCQGISGFNRYRHYCDPLEDKKNRQLVVFMNIVEFLKPRYVLMENVTDILKFAKGQLASYAVGRLVSMNYQARLGIMAAGAYGVPQCRMRFFLWGAGPMEEIIVGHGMNRVNCIHCFVGDVISDLPEVANDAHQDEMPYGSAPHTVFQKFIRLKRHDIFGYTGTKKNDPLQSGANFRNLPGVLVGPDNVVRLDPSVKRALCTSGKPLVPDYAIKFEAGRSSKPFGRLGTDDIVATVVTRAEPHNQVILHPDQDRVLSVRENARLQGFPDCYKLYGPIKERYMQVGNAVSFSVSIPLGYCLAKAMQGASSTTPLTIPFQFPDCLGQLKSARQESELDAVAFAD